MQWDLGPQGVATLGVMSLVFGLFAQLVFWHKASLLVGLAATVAFFVVGVFISEVMFGWATGEDIQPNIDGLSFDETMLAYGMGVPLVILLRYFVRGGIGPPIIR